MLKETQMDFCVFRSFYVRATINLFVNLKTYNLIPSFETSFDRKRG